MEIKYSAVEVNSAKTFGIFQLFIKSFRKIKIFGCTVKDLFGCKDLSEVEIAIS